MVQRDSSPWVPFDWFVLRATGFSFERILPMGDEAVWHLDELTYQGRLQRSREALWAWCDDPAFREAVFMSSPQVYSLLDCWQGGFNPCSRKRKDRKRERTLYRFLTRFVGKNDTTSFFGATSLGRLSQPRSGDLNLPVARVRRVFLEHWVARALGRKISDDLQLSEPIVLPVGEPRVLDFLKNAMGSSHPQAGVWVKCLDQVAQLLKAFETAGFDRRRMLFGELETLVSDWLEGPVRRGAGEYYASRTVIHEVGDRSGEVVGLQARERNALRHVSTLMEFCALHTLVDRLKMSAFLRARMGGRTLGFSEISGIASLAGNALHLEAPVEARRLYTALGDARARMRRRVDASLASNGADQEVELLDDELVALLSEWAPALDRTGRGYTNPDILFESTDGALRPVMGDMHAMPFLTPAAYAAAPHEAEAWTATGAFLEQLCAPEAPAFLVHDRPSFVAYVPDFGEVALEMDARSGQPDERRASFGSLRGHWTPDGLTFQAQVSSGEWVPVAPLTRSANVMSRYSSLLQCVARVYPLRLFGLGEWLAGPGWRGIGQLPRLCLDGAVVHRRAWVVESKRWLHTDPRRALRALKDETGGSLPRFCYVKGGDDPKPLLVDFFDPVSAELLVWMARGDAALTLSEMLPGSDGLWLHGPGGRYTSEVRTVFVR